MLGEIFKNSTEISRKAIFKRSMHNPILHSCIQEWQRGRITFESAMKHAVMALIESNDSMTSQSQTLYMNGEIVIEKKNRITKLEEGIRFAIDELQEWNPNSEAATELQSLLEKQEE